jgi:EAL and modified HD-GYP domain-containing signal transduction protein
MSGQQFFLGRQPIMGRERELVAYELLFRSSETNAAAISDDMAASSVVIQHTFTDLGVQSALGNKRGFINLSEDLLMSDIIEMLPRDRVVLEILETVRLTEEVVARCRQLKRAGYALALDDVTVLTEERKTVLPFMKFVKLDVLQMGHTEIGELVAGVKPYGIGVLAEKIDTQEQYDTCWALGFDLFQGYFFAKPVILSGHAMQPSTVALLKLFALTARDAEIDEIETALKQAPDLTVRLLRMANSVGVSPVNKISGIRNAIAVLGRRQINRLAQIMMFARNGAARPGTDPLLQAAVVRGRLMESMAESLGWHALKDRAFMVGMLSLVDALFGQTLSDLVDLLNLDDSVRAAVMNRDGRLGTLLQLAEALERVDVKQAAMYMDQLGLRDFDRLNRMQVEALIWAGKF